MGDEKARRFFSFLDRKIKCRFRIFYDCCRGIFRQIGTIGNFPRHSTLFLRGLPGVTGWRSQTIAAEKCISMKNFVWVARGKNAFGRAFCV